MLIRAHVSQSLTNAVSKSHMLGTFMLGCYVLLGLRPQVHVELCSAPCNGHPNGFGIVSLDRSRHGTAGDALAVRLLQMHVHACFGDPGQTCTPSAGLRVNMLKRLPIRSKCKRLPRHAPASQYSYMDETSRALVSTTLLTILTAHQSLCRGLCGGSAGQGIFKSYHACLAWFAP